MRFRAHFDGRVIVPHESVNLPVDEPLSIEVDKQPEFLSGLAATPEERQAALNRFFSQPTPRTNALPDEATRRESIYADDDELT